MSALRWLVSIPIALVLGAALCALFAAAVYLALLYRAADCLSRAVCGRRGIG